MSLDTIIHRLLHRQPGRGLLLYICALPLLPTMFIALATGQTIKALTGGMVLAGWVLSAKYLSQPRQNRQAAHSTGLFTLAILLAATSTGFAAWLLAGHNEVNAVLFALTAALGMLLTYRTEPELLKVEAQRLLTEILRGGAYPETPDINPRLARFSEQMHNLLQTPELPEPYLRGLLRCLNQFGQLTRRGSDQDSERARLARHHRLRMALTELEMLTLDNNDGLSAQDLNILEQTLSQLTMEHRHERD